MVPEATNASLSARRPALCLMKAWINSSWLLRISRTEAVDLIHPPGALMRISAGPSSAASWRSGPPATCLALRPRLLLEYQAEQQVSCPPWLGMCWASSAGNPERALVHAQPRLKLTPDRCRPLLAQRLVSDLGIGWPDHAGQSVLQGRDEFQLIAIADRTSLRHVATRVTGGTIVDRDSRGRSCTFAEMERRGRKLNRICIPSVSPDAPKWPRIDPETHQRKTPWR